MAASNTMHAASINKTISPRCGPGAAASEIVRAPARTDLCAVPCALPFRLMFFIIAPSRSSRSGPIRRGVYPPTLADVNKPTQTCRSKMRMSGLCKVEMYGFIQGRRADGTGANRVEHEGTGAVEGAARRRARPSETGGSGAASAIERPPGTALADAAANSGRWRDRAWVARSPLEPENSRDLGAACSAPAAPGPLCRIRAHTGGRASGTQRPGGEPGDAAPVDECRWFVAVAPAARESDACVAAAALCFRRTGDDGQLALSLAGSARPGLPLGGPDR